MASTQIDKILAVYKQVAQSPSVVSARIITAAKNAISVRSRWSQRNLERRKKQKFLQDFSFDKNLELFAESFPTDVSSEIITTSSKDETLDAILRDVTVDGKSKQFIEIWDKKHFIKSYDLSAFDVHGEVYSDGTFGAFHWSPDNTRLLYVAEKKLSKSEPFYKQKPKPKANKTGEDEEPLRGNEYIYKPEWGEQLVGKHRSVIVILNIQNDTIVPVDNIPDDYFPSQVLWAPNGEDIVGVAYKLYPRYLGLVFCTNRESYIFHLKGKEFRKLTAERLSCRSPRFSPDGKTLVWLEREISAPHHHVHRLMYIKWEVDEKPAILVDVVKTYSIINNNKKFYGLYNQNLLKRCWSEDSQYIFLSTVQRFNIKSYIVNLESKEMTEINNPESNSLTILDVHQNYVLSERSSLVQLPHLVIGKFDALGSDIGNLNLITFTDPPSIFNAESVMYYNEDFVYDNNDFVKDFNFTYFGPNKGTDKSLPLIVVPHGGPQSAFTNDFVMSHAILALLGFGILQVNYRGSTGMGGDNVEYILGKVGQSDVLDCVTATNSALKKYPWLSPEKVTVSGGSHGGFLAAHLSAQYPNLFKAVVMRNPAIDLVAMFSVTDIPDWCPAQTGCFAIGQLPDTTSESNYPELIQILLKHSPILIADKVKAPTLIGLGSNDLRVPFSQGKLWYNRLTTNKVITKLYIYDDNHSLSKDEVEIDFNIHATLWLMEHTGHQ